MNRTLYLGGEDFEIRTWSDAGRSGAAVDFHDRETALHFLERLLADPHTIDALRSLAAEALSGPGPEDHEVIELLSWLLLDGSLRVTRLPSVTLGGSGDVTETEPARVEGRTVKDWVEIVLVDDEGHPVSGADYEITLPDGSSETGQTDAAGQIRLSGIDPGVCKFSFTKLHPGDWSRA